MHKRRTEYEGFKLGDRVIVTRRHPQGNETLCPGDMGTVCNISSSSIHPIGVQWDRSVSGHNCDKCCTTGYGWYVHPTDIALQDDSVEWEPMSMDALAEFAGV